MTHPDGQAPDRWAPLVPELGVRDLARSLAFWRDLLGFRLVYGRPEEGFAYLELEGLQVMLEELGPGSWVTGELAPPLGRGLNLQMEVSRLGPLLGRLAAAGWPLWRPPEERWYRAGAVEHGQRQVLVQDPDGYLLRFCEALGERAAAPEAKL
jgi:catechol 2,3-dioxygenase-like lactoylglutathione lyase family enzyme